MKSGQLIEYNMRKIFFENSYIKCDGETSPIPYSEKLRLNIFLDQQSKVLYNFFLLYTNLRALET